jgi:hypothetical protein
MEGMHIDIYHISRYICIDLQEIIIECSTASGRYKLELGYGRINMEIDVDIDTGDGYKIQVPWNQPSVSSGELLAKNLTIYVVDKYGNRVNKSHYVVSIRYND